MAKSTGTGTTFGGVWCKRMLENRQGFSCTNPVDKQTNK